LLYATKANDGVTLMKVGSWKSIAICLALCTLAHSGFAETITRLPDWFGAKSVRSFFMLPDGQTFVGVDGTDVFRWTAAEGRSNLGTIPETYGSPLRATNVSDDGSTIIGYVGDGEFSALGGFVWNAASGMKLIADSSDGVIRYPVPTAVSADGSRIVGHAKNWPNFPFGQGDPAVFLWTPQTGTQSLGFAGYPEAITADGTTVVGSRPVAENTNEAFRWTEATGPQGLGYLASEMPSSSASLVSRDGSIVVGGSFGAPPVFGPKAFRWTDETGMQELGTRGDDQTIFGVSADGSVMYGNMRTVVPGLPGPTFSHDQFIWSEQIGLRTLPEVLAALKLEQQLPFSSPNMSEQLLGISGDGRTLLGSTVEYIFDPPAVPNFPGIPTVRIEYWLLDISAVPEPSTSGICCIALATMMALCRRRSSVCD
jgi:uncharacterized membrane protein